jgi:hypothetical protein
MKSASGLLSAGALLLLLPGRALGHGKMLAPAPRQPEPMYWYQVGCMAGCTCSGGGKETYPTAASMNCVTPTEPTLPVEKRTWNTAAASPKGDWNKYMPWRAPGTSVPLDACGIASGFDPKAAVQYPHSFAAASNVKQGDKGSELKVGKVTEWEAGATVTASWTLVVNHGGGYQYRVCPTGGGKPVTNDCFEENPLAFADGEQTVHFSAAGNDPVKIVATDVSEGVRPAGAAWRRLPIPACACDLGSGCTGNASKPNATADYVPYGKDNSAPAHGACKNGLQFAAPHLAKDWPEGFGYYVSELGKAAAATKGGADACSSAATEDACGNAGGDCTWYGPKSLCYTKKDTKRRGLKDAEKTDKCAVHKSETPCADVTGCAWYASKSTCYSDGSDAKDFSGNSAVAYGDSQWWISDALVAPTELGSYVLQWRWDNEQTPQVWTTCADVQVVEKKESGAEARHRGAGLLRSMAAAAAAAAAVLLVQ